jgi:hypothetical protein
MVRFATLQHLLTFAEATQRPARYQSTQIVHASIKEDNMCSCSKTISG